MNGWAKVALAGGVILVLAPISLVLGWMNGTTSLLFLSIGLVAIALFLWGIALVGYLVSRSRNGTPAQ